MEIKGAIAAVLLLMSVAFGGAAVGSDTWLNGTSGNHNAGLWKDCVKDTAGMTTCTKLENIEEFKTYSCFKKFLPSIKAARAFLIMGTIVAFLGALAAGGTAVRPNLSLIAACLALTTFLFLMIGWDIGTGVYATHYRCDEVGTIYMPKNHKWGAAFACGIISWLLAPIAMVALCLVRPEGGERLLSADQL